MGHTCHSCGTSPHFGRYSRTSILLRVGG